MVVYPHEKPLTKSQTDLLNDVYYKQGNFYATRKLYPIVQSQAKKNPNLPHIYEAQIDGWLRNQSNYQMTRKPPRRLDVDVITSDRVGQTLQCDLLQLQNTPSKAGNSFVFTCIDVFSRYLWAIPIREKTAERVLECMEQVVKECAEHGHVVRRISTDNGSEFNKLHTIDGVTVVRGVAGLPTSQGMVERVHNTIRQYIRRYNISEGTTMGLWEIPLKKFVEVYNDTVHSGSDKKPIDVFEGTEEPKRRELADKVESSLLPVGSWVRVRTNFKPSLDKTVLPWSKEVYQVEAVKKGTGMRRATYLVGGRYRSRYDLQHIPSPEPDTNPFKPQPVPRSTAPAPAPEVPVRREPSTRVRRPNPKYMD